MNTEQNPPATVQAIVDDTLSGNANFRAWYTVVNALYLADKQWCPHHDKSALENATLWIADAGERKKEALELADMLRGFMRAANSRGRLSPGGCDANTEEGHMYSQALDYFAAHGYPC